MREWRTKPLDRPALLAELAAVAEALRLAGVRHADVSFGWDSNLAVDEMWKAKPVLVEQLVAFAEASERAGLIDIGASDLLIEALKVEFVLCHEGDAHISGESVFVRQIVDRWCALDYAPHEIGKGSATQTGPGRHIR